MPTAELANRATTRRSARATTRRAARAAWRTVRHRQLSPAHFRLVTGLAVWALAFIIVTGALVRLTGSGLGCTDWPGCTNTDIVAPWRFHAWVEFGNRLVTGLVSVAVCLAVAAALIRAPRRRDLTWLSLGLVGGLVAEIVLGGLTVEHQLAPGYVTAHFLLALLFLADAIVLHHRAALADDVPPATQPAQTHPPQTKPAHAKPAGTPVAMVSREQVILARLLLVAASVVCLLGTVVTSTGPHGGAPEAPRFAFSLHDVAQLHGTSVEVFLFFTLLTLWSMSRSGVARPVMRRGELLLVVLVAQGGIGYLQYFTGVPAALVALHIVGVVSVVWATLSFNLGLYTRVPSGSVPEKPVPDQPATAKPGTTVAPELVP